MKKTHPLLSTVLAALLPLSIGCQGGPRLDASEVYLMITSPDGDVTEEVLPFDEVVAPALDGLPTFEVDGRSTTNPADLLTGQRAELVLLDGQSLVIERSGDTLTRIAPSFPDEAGIPSVAHLSGDHRTLEIEVPGGSSFVELDGIDDAEIRGRVMALMAVRSLGAQVGLRGERETPHLDPATAVVTISLAAIFTTGAVIAYATCVWQGTRECGRHADRMCPGGSNDVEFTTICGAGFDLAGQFQLGYHCSYRCR